jgi:hypothetical protein
MLFLSHLSRVHFVTHLETQHLTRGFLFSQCIIENALELFFSLLSDLTDKKWFSRSVSHKQERPVERPCSLSFSLSVSARTRGNGFCWLIDLYPFSLLPPSSPQLMCVVCVRSPLQLYLFMCHLTEFLWPFVMFHSTAGMRWTTLGLN